MNDYNNFTSSNRVVETDHKVELLNRRNLEISGVKEVDSFDNEEFLLETIQGYMIIRGEHLQLKSLDVSAGKLIIKGKIHAFSYIDETQGEKAKGFFSKMFR